MSNSSRIVSSRDALVLSFFSHIRATLRHDDTADKIILSTTALRRCCGQLATDVEGSKSMSEMFNLAEEMGVAIQPAEGLVRGTLVLELNDKGKV